MIWLLREPTSSGDGLVVALLESAPSAIGSTPAVAGLVVRTIGPPPPEASGSGGTTMLVVSDIALTSDCSCIACVPPVASLHEASSLMRLNCGMLGAIDAPAA